MMSGMTAYAADTLGISQVKIEAGADAAEKLESGGYTVIYQNLNPSGGERIYLGYKLETKAITGLVVLTELKASVSADSVSYSPVFSVNLNGGTKGKPVYLYSTTDSKAGSAILSLNFVKDSKDGTVNLLDNFGDGSVIVRTSDGGAADFDEGIAARDLYLFMIKDNSCKPYVSDIKIVNVSSEENAFKKIVVSGCDYFNREPVAKSDGISAYLCCNRTADASTAVRLAAVSDNAEIDGITYTGAGSFNLNGKTVNLYYTKDKTVGNPVSEITKGSLSSENFTLSDWAKSYFSDADFYSNMTVDSADNSHGGAIYSDYSDCEILIKDSVFGGNYSEDCGGAFYVNDGKFTAMNCLFNSNKCLDDGGAAYCNSSDGTRFSGVFRNNSAGGVGGALFVNGDKVSVQDAVITNNTTGDRGGAMYVDEMYDINIQGNLVVKNNYKSDGSRDDIFLDSVAVASAEIYDGGLYEDSEVWVLTSGSSQTVCGNISAYQQRYFHCDDSSKTMKFTPDSSKTQKQLLITSAIGDGNIKFIIIAAAAVLITAAAIVIVKSKKKGAKKNEKDA